MIQIVAYREYLPQGKEKLVGYQRVEEVKAGSIRDLFENLADYLGKIAPDEQWNLHYTCAQSQGKSRTFIEQDIIPLDFDYVQMDRLEEYLAVIFPVLGVKREDVTIVKSGHGFHIIIFLDYKITTEEELKKLKPHFDKLCFEINKAFIDAGLPGEADPLRFVPSATMRLPGTQNIKKGCSDTFCEIHSLGTRELAFHLEDYRIEEKAGPKTSGGDSLAAYPTPDTQAVLAGCPFLVYCKEKQAEVNEPQWYAMLSVVARLDKGQELCHAYSCESPQYSEAATNAKIDRAMNETGPITCAKVSTFWGGCKECPHWGLISSPISIKGPDWIASRDTGFWTFEKGKQPSPNYEDLLKYFSQKTPVKTPSDTGYIYTYDGKKWEITYPLKIHSFAMTTLNPSPKPRVCKEFAEFLAMKTTVDGSFFNPAGYLNLNNGILELKTMELLPHSTDWGFTYCLKHDFDATATCPKFDKFMEDITCGDKQLENLLLEFVAYVVSFAECDRDKALILHGEGSNGKSTFLNVIKELIGNSNYSSASLEELSKAEGRNLLVNKMANIVEEETKKSLMENSVFKNLVSGGDTTAKKLYIDKANFKNKAKLVFACNEIPINVDNTEGMFRRIILIPFNATFEGIEKDEKMEYKLFAELPGILNRIISSWRNLEFFGFSNSTKASEALAEYRENSDTVLTFVNESLEVNPHIPDTVGDAPFITTSILYDHYDAFCKRRNSFPLKVENFGKRLRIILKKIDKHDKRHTRKRMGKGPAKYGFFNIEIIGREF